MAVPSSAKTYQDIYKGLGSLPFQTDMDAVRARQAQLAGFLGTSDYASRMEEANNLAKFQMALAMAQRGFAGMGATPKRGQSGASALLSNVFAPLAGDIGTVAVPLMQQRAAAKTAQEQEERQLKLAALSQVQAEEAARRNVALKLTPTTTAKGPYELPRFVVKRNASGEYEFPDPDNPKQVRQQKGAAHPIDLRTLRPYELKEGEILVTGAELPENLKGTVSGDASALQAGDFNLRKPDGTLYTVTVNGKTRTPVYRAIGKGKGQRGQIVELGTGDTFDQSTIKAQGLTPQRIITSAAKTKPAGIKSAEAIANWEGFLAGLGSLQESLNLGGASIRFNPEKYASNQQPFTYYDGSALSEKDGKRIFGEIEKIYYNLTKEGYQPGQEEVDINQRAANTIFNRSLSSYALADPKSAAQVTADEIPPERLLSKVAQDQRYTQAPEGFKTNPVAAETLARQPVPNIANYGRGVARLKLFQNIGVDFGEDTTAPGSLRPNIPEPQLQEALTDRARDISRLSDDTDPIQTRMDAEALSIGTTLATTLNAQASTPDKRDKAVSDALEKARETRATIQQKTGNKEAASDLGSAINAYDSISNIRVLLARGRVPGFIRGSLEVGGRKLFGLELGAWFRTIEGQKAANAFIASLPGLQQTVARQLLRAAGEGSRMSNKDLQGMQGVLPKAGENFEYSTDKIKALDRHLRSGIQSLLEGIGDFKPSKALLTKAASLGFDLKSIKGKNNYYDPFLKDRNYKVTKQPVPSYSREHQTQLRDKGILGFVTRFVPGQPVHYELMILDPKGQPVWDDQKKKWRTTLVSEAGLQVPQNRKMVRFNTDWLKREHKLDR